MAYLSVKDGRLKPTGSRGGKLTPKMLSFIDQYFGAASFNATEAVRLSDYKTTNHPEVQAAELLNHPNVVEEIERRQKARGAVAEVKAEYLINKLMQIIEREQEENPSAALRAIELAGKSIALWKERQEISGVDGEAIKHEQQIKESVADFTSRISGLVKRARTDNVVEFPERSGAGGA